MLSCSRDKPKATPKHSRDSAYQHITFGATTIDLGTSYQKGFGPTHRKKDGVQRTKTQKHRVHREPGKALRKNKPQKTKSFGGNTNFVNGTMPQLDEHNTTRLQRIPRPSRQTLCLGTGPIDISPDTTGRASREESPPEARRTPCWPFHSGRAVPGRW